MYYDKKIKRIGLFDSGIGGLTVLKELLNLPMTDYVYVADTANIPYGQKTAKQILQYSQSIAAFLVTQKIDALVIACHTSSAVTLAHLQQTFPLLPIIGTINETMLYATKQTSNKRIGIMATQATINSHMHKRKLLTVNPELEVFEVACPQLVPLIEAPLLDVQQIERVLREYLTPLMQTGIDTLILGCTHYPLITHEIKKIVGDAITIVSSEKIIAQTLFHQSAISTEARNIACHVTGDASNFAQKAHAILGHSITVQQLDIHGHPQSMVESPVNLGNTV